MARPGSPWGASITARGVTNYDLPPGTYRLGVTTATGVYATITGVPLGGQAPSSRAGTPASDQSGARARERGNGRDAAAVLSERHLPIVVILLAGPGVNFKVSK